MTTTSTDHAAVSPQLPAAYDDAAVVARSILEPHVFASLYDRHSATFLRYALSRVGADHAEDVVGDAFVDAFRRRATFNPDVSRSALPWLLGYATQAIRHQRRTERSWLASCAAAKPAALEHTAALTEGLPDRLDARAAAPVLTRTLSALKRGDREVLALLVIVELSVEETAATLGIPPGTVKSRMHRARRILAANLEAHVRP